ncbi:MAG TPA: hypothetical protein VGD33_11905 [Chitinophagaceae bacterium]
MSACNFSIAFTGDPEQVLNNARSAVQGQGGNFSGDTNTGQFDVSFFGNTIAGSYSVSGQQLNIIIDSKPFMVPCSAIESFLKSKIGV